MIHHVMRRGRRIVAQNQDSFLVSCGKYVSSGARGKAQAAPNSGEGRCLLARSREVPLGVAYQSEPSISPPEGVTAAHQVSPLMLGASVRTLPSARPTSIPA